jgi:hypothetical protein
MCSVHIAFLASATNRPNCQVPYDALRSDIAKDKARSASSWAPLGSHIPCLLRTRKPLPGRFTACVKHAHRASLLSFGIPTHERDCAQGRKLHTLCTMMASLPQLRMMP